MPDQLPIRRPQMAAVDRLIRLSAGHGEKLSRGQERAIAALLSEPNLAGAAKKAGVGERTLRRWMKLPTFTAAYTEARKELMTSAVGRLTRSIAGAITVLRKIAANDKEPAAARVSACRAIISAAFAGTEVHDLVERVAAIENHLVAQFGGRVIR